MSHHHFSKRYVPEWNTYILFRDRQEIGMLYPDKNLIKLHPTQYTIEKIAVDEDLKKVKEQAENVIEALNDFADALKNVGRKE